MIGLGAKLIAEFHWVLYLFAAFLILTAIKMLFLKTEHTDPNKNFVVRLTRRLFPVTARFHGQHFIVRAGCLAGFRFRSTLPPKAGSKSMWLTELKKIILWSIERG